MRSRTTTKCVVLAGAWIFLQGCSAAVGDSGAVKTVSPPADVCPSGECLPTDDPTGWRRVFADDFTETVPAGGWTGCSAYGWRCSGLPEAYRSGWWAFPEGWPDPSGYGGYSPARTLSAHDGLLDIHMHTDQGVHLASAPVPLIHGNGGPLGRLYGRYAVRFRSDPLHGYKIAWLLWPDSETWPRDGEIDFPEAELDGSIAGFVHHRMGTAPDDQTGFSTGVPFAGAWHTAVIEWTRNRVRFLLDGTLAGETTERIPDTPMHWVLEATVTLDGYEPEDSAEGHILIDWVAVSVPQE
jgi:hypothetical protein